MTKLFLGAVAALALLSASPASACGDDCPAHKKEAAAKATSSTTVAEADKKDTPGCKCGAKTAKDCKCGDKCHCYEASKDAKKADKKS